MEDSESDFGVPIPGKVLPPEHHRADNTHHKNTNTTRDGRTDWPDQFTTGFSRPPRGVNLAS